MAPFKYTVLLIDDDSFFSDVIGNKLAAEGIGCVYASSASVALEVLKKETPNVILLDVMMPEMNGLDLLKVLKSDPHTKTIPIIMFSNDANDESVEKSKSLGAVLYLEKVNVTPGEVVSAILSLIEPK